MTELEQSSSAANTLTEPAQLSTSNKPNKLLATKLNKVLGSSVSDDARIKAALSALSDIPDLDETDLRRNLRGTIEKKEIEANKKFLEGFSRVVDQLETLESQVEGMDVSCQEMKGKLDQASEQTAEMIEQAHNLQDRSSACDARITIVDKFLEKFTLSEQEINTLCSSAVPIGDDFFVALNHLKQIHSDCRVLLMTQNQQAGLHIMESMALHQETAYEKLYRWTQYESRASFGRDSIDVSTLMTKGLHALRHRPVLFQTILDDLAVARREAVGRAFINALTRGGPGGTPRPIELQAHDSLRYIGDMLAWIHQACASEKEMLESLFQGSPGTRRREASSAEAEDGEESHSIIHINDAIDELLDYAMEGTCRPLKSRMEQVLVLQPGAITSYRVANLIQFYSVTVGKLLRKSAALAKVLYDITEMAYKYFFKTLNAQADRLLQSADPPTKELTISPVVREMTLQLKEIVSSYDSSYLIASGEADGLRTFDFGETLDAIVDPLVQMCELSVQKFSSVERDVYVVNCIQHIETALSSYPFTEQKRENLSERTNHLLQELAAEQYRDLLHQSGLSEIDNAVRTKDADKPLSKVSKMDTQSVSTALSNLDSFLITISAGASPELRKLTSSEHYHQVQDNAIRMLLDAYRRIHVAVEDPKNEYEYPDRILPRTIEEMEAIFSFAL
ncbi:oligomeric Golgi complex subunit 6-like protein [Zychaea mexicana]|uniref:oligomeric Golgi complex subunit 6-like protein n=1 Tax=Zychaea mexicana TaxID=64656 RepID=UPI0022FEE319|nr:oligomeric Golgi complex subunit 6-like protein [Zychaea mexicana]KAI9484688.1 oligomeric Golgi complex subunit 6-like protein [Zychaea mexicana]